MNHNISFIVPAYNADRFLRETIDSIYNGNFTEGDEVIIIDDASTDKTVTVAKKLQKKHPEIAILQHRINKGSAAAGRNTGIDYSKNDLIFTLDADNILIPGSVPKLKSFMISEQADAAAFGELHYFETSPEVVTHKWVFTNPVTLADVLAGNLNPCPSGNYLFTRKSWLRADRYNEQAKVLDSWGFGFCQIAKGSRFVTLQGTAYLHRYGHLSHNVVNAPKCNTSMLGLQIVLPFIDLIVEEDVEYIMSPEGRFTWFFNLAQRPIRLKTGETGQKGHMVMARERTVLNKIGMRLKRAYQALTGQWA